MIHNVFTPGSHGSTFGGNPLAMAVAREALRVLVDEDLHGRSRRLGAVFRLDLEAIGHPAIREVRGAGLWAGVVLRSDLSARAVCLAMLRRGVLAKDTHGHVVRLAPPLTIREQDLAFAVEVLGEAIDEVASYRSS